MLRLSENFICRRVCGETLLMPVGEKTKEFNGIFTLSETGAFLLNEISVGSDADTAASNLASQFEISDEVAKGDAREFFEQLLSYGILVNE